MPRTQEGLARLIDRERLKDDRISTAFRTVDRADFVPENLRSIAYRDRPVGIPEDQTTSQPSLIARMIDVTRPQPADTALEVGTGHGFHTRDQGDLPGIAAYGDDTARAAHEQQILLNG